MFAAVLLINNSFVVDMLCDVTFAQYWYCTKKKFSTFHRPQRNFDITAHEICSYLFDLYAATMNASAHVEDKDAFEAIWKWSPVLDINKVRFIEQRCEFSIRTI